MSKENAVAFIKRLKEDVEFRGKLAEDESLKDKNIETVMAAASDLGYSFDKEDLQQAAKELMDMELSDNDLDRVSGGYNAIEASRRYADLYKRELEEELMRQELKARQNASIIESIVLKNIWLILKN